MRGAGLLISAAVLAAASPATAGNRARSAALVLPQVATAPRCDGELDELAWRTPARTGAFVAADGRQAAPYSDARFLRDDRYLYVALYAADEDIRASDAFVLELASARGKRTLRFTAGGTLAPALAGGHIAIDVDGSVDDPSNDDEEWVVEAAVPLSAIPFAADGSVHARITRCDTTKDQVRHCGAWGGMLVRR